MLFGTLLKRAKALECYGGPLEEAVIVLNVAIATRGKIILIRDYLLLLDPELPTKLIDFCLQRSNARL